MIVTFYSFKGGVGRSMAMANVANWLRLQKLRVLAIDWDLEAPGLEGFFYADAANRERIRSLPGVVDLIAGYKQRHAKLPAAFFSSGSSSPNSSVTGSQDETAQSRADVLAAALPPIESLVVPVFPDRQREESSHPLHLMPAGTRNGESEGIYASEVQRLDWSEFYDRYDGAVFFRWFRQVIESAFDIVLIDSRTGLTEVGGVCTRQLADVVVSLSAPNDQNIEGVIRMTQSFYRDSLITARGGRALRAAIVPARYDNAENAQLTHFQSVFVSKIEAIRNLEKDPTWKGLDPAFLWEMRIPYVPDYAYAEKLCVGALGANADLEKQYQRLAEFITSIYVGSLDDHARAGLSVRSPALAALVEEQVQVSTSIGQRLEAAFGALSEATRAAAPSVLLRLVGFAAENRPVAVERPLHEFTGEDRAHVDALVAAGILEFPSNSAPQSVRSNVPNASLGARNDLVRLAHPDAVTEWRRLRDWIAADSAYLYQRHRLRSAAADYARTKSPDFLLPAGELGRVRAIVQSRPDTLSQEIAEFLSASERELNRRGHRQRLIVAAVAAIFMIAGGFAFWKAKDTERRHNVAAAAISEAQSLYQDESYDDAFQRVSQALVADPTSSTALTLRGQIYLAQNKTDTALNSLNRAIATDPGNAVALRVRGETYFVRNDMTQALADLESSVRASGDDPETYFQRGRVLQSMGRNEEAIRDYKRVLSLKPDNWAAALNLSSAFRSVGHLDSSAFLLLDIAVNAQDSEQRASAAALLKGTGYSLPSPASMGVDRIVIHYINPADQPTVSQVRSALARASLGTLDAPKIVTQMAGGSVRYFFPQDADRASQVRSLVLRTLKAANVAVDLKTLPLNAKDFPKARPGLIEVWLPSLSNTGTVTPIRLGWLVLQDDQWADLDSGLVSTESSGGDLLFRSASGKNRNSRLTTSKRSSWSGVAPSGCGNPRVCSGARTGHDEVQSDQAPGTCWCVRTDRHDLFQVTLLTAMQQDSKSIRIRYVAVPAASSGGQ